MLRRLFQALQAKSMLTPTLLEQVQPQAGDFLAGLPPNALRQLEAAAAALVAAIPWLSHQQATTVQAQLVQTFRRQLIFEINGTTLLAGILLVAPEDLLFFEGVAAWIRGLIGWSPEPEELERLAQKLRCLSNALPQRPPEQLLAVVVWSDNCRPLNTSAPTKSACISEPNMPQFQRWSIGNSDRRLFNFTKFKDYWETILRQPSLNWPQWSAVAAGLIIITLITTGFANKDKFLGSAVNAAIPSKIQQPRIDAMVPPVPLTTVKREFQPGPIGEYEQKIVMRATAYDLSVESCGKSREHPEYGITYSGKRATVGRTVALDPQVVPLGSRVYIAFPRPYQQLNGVYSAEDTGRLVKGYRVDIFFGEDRPGERIVYQKTRQFGVQPVELYLLK